MASDVAQTIDMGDRALVLDLADPEAAAATVVEAAGRHPLDAVVAVDDQGVLVGALAAARLGLAHNPPEAVAATRDKAAMRTALAAAGTVRQPSFVIVPTRRGCGCRRGRGRLSVRRQTRIALRQPGCHPGRRPCSGGRCRGEGAGHRGRGDRGR